MCKKRIRANKALLSYVPQNNKLILVLSTMHERVDIDEKTGLPKIIYNYNETKAEVDTSPKCVQLHWTEMLLSKYHFMIIV